MKIIELGFNRHHQTWKTLHSLIILLKRICW